MTLETQRDWEVEVEALFHYLEVVRRLTPPEAQALIRLLHMSTEPAIPIN